MTEEGADRLCHLSSCAPGRPQETQYPNPGKVFIFHSLCRRMWRSEQDSENGEGQCCESNRSSSALR